jgi:iron(III) transport system substrate-binding protein
MSHPSFTLEWESLLNSSCSGSFIKKGHMRRIYITTISIALILLAFCAANAQTEQEKIEGAKKEGPVYWYGSMNVDDASALTQALMKKYPFMDIKRFRASNAPILSKLEVEARARGLNVDLIDFDGFYVVQAMKRNYWTPYFSPELAAFPKQLRDPRGLWSGFYLLPQAVIYNTHLVPPASAPKSYQELLNPEWKGRIAIPDSAVTWYHGMLQYMGVEKGRAFMKRLAAQNIQFLTGNRLMVELTMAGEHAVGIGAYGHRIGQFQRKGAPMDWIKDDVLITTPQAIGISGYGKARNSAELIVDFVLSREGQAVLRRSGRIPANPKVDPAPPELLRGRKIYYSDIVDGGTRYNELNEEFRKTFGVD